MAPATRPRNAATKRRAISSEFKAKTTVVKKTKKPIFIPRDFLLDSIFPFLTNRQLYPLRFVQRNWKRLIETGVAKRQLSWRPVLHKITFTDHKYLCGLPYVVNLGKTHPILKEGEKATLRIWSRSYFYVYIEPQAGGYSRRRLMLKLPKYPATSGQIRFVRQWLHQLSQAHFEIGEYRADVLNPEFTGIVFPADEGSQEENFCLSFETFKMRSPHKSLSQIVRISRIEFRAYDTTASDHVDFFLDCRHPIRSALIRHYKIGGDVKFIINMAKRLKQLDAGALLGGQLPRTMDFKALLYDSFVNPGTSMAALTDAQPAGLIRHVATRVDEEDDLMKWIDFVVECADGTVNVCISVEMKHYEYIQAEYISKIMVKIVEAH